jgi:allantoinase
MADIRLVIRGTVVLPRQTIVGGHVAVGADGRVAAYGAGKGPAAAEVADYGDCLILPGAIDAQVHSRSQAGQEDFIWSTRAAAAGGVTTIVDMPYDDGNLIATGDKLRAKAREAGAQARVDFALYGTLAPDSDGAEVADLVAAGAAAFKFSTFGTHPQRFPRIPPQALHRFFAKIAPTGVTAGVHNENDEYVRAAIAEVEASGITDYRAHNLSRPALSEALATAEVYEIGAATGCPAHIVHCSIGRGYELCSAYRQQGVAASIEACIHYLILSEEDDVSRLGGFAKINPPIRPRAEREALWRHLGAGDITLVSTDHVSWSRDRKDNPNMLKNASGAPGLEAMYALLLGGLESRGLPFGWAARLLAENPARHFRLHEKGALEIGKHADVAVFRRAPYKYDAKASGHNFVDWSPYDGLALDWRPEATFLRGERVFEAGAMLAEPGRGRFVAPLTREAV